MNPIRAIIIPDPGYVLVEGDLKQADLQTVVWEADDADLKRAIREGINMHLRNAAEMYNLPIPEDECKATHPNFPEHKARYKEKYAHAKAGIHATNFGVGERTLGATLKISSAEAKSFQRRWFSAHPGIKRWHERVMDALKAYLPIRNAFGYQIIFQDRPSTSFKHALAFTPQSTTGLCINKGWKRIWDTHPEYQVLIQSHDALLMQVPEERFPACIPELEECMTIKVPYTDPLYIGIDFKWSPRSWGEMEELT